MCLSVFVEESLLHATTPSLCCWCYHERRDEHARNGGHGVVAAQSEGCDQTKEGRRKKGREGKGGHVSRSGSGRVGENGKGVLNRQHKHTEIHTHAHKTGGNNDVTWRKSRGR